MEDQYKAASGSSSFIHTGGASSSFAGSQAGVSLYSLLKSRSMVGRSLYSASPEFDIRERRTKKCGIEASARYERSLFPALRRTQVASQSEPGSPLLVALGILVLITLLTSAFGFDKPDVTADPSLQIPQSDSQIVQ
jgi:hypothetical protein